MTDEETYTETRKCEAKHFRAVVAKLKRHTIGHRATEVGARSYWGRPSHVLIHVKPQHAARLEKFIATTEGEAK